MTTATRRLLGVWLLLVLLLAITVGTAFLDLGPWNASINLAIAAVKALLIAGAFMHLARAATVLRLAAVVPLAILTILFVLMHGDYASRPHLPAVWQTPAAPGGR
ncbi:cytochrome c oxidase subunit 4 [Ralstonia sp. 25mfcol4.1]|uniref:cytochrome C oxidase subunit IV family protein n=1 Tax=Burkholderiaceae TaxID=119060 RepID=UPI0008901047|nr:cytochrome C oxidase subunit IV family protein [Ralstonia sp. 25mfcol4.1]SDP17842.1 cytochrome c oxidase subunit 4 [Ralstonia sp. 25mfcol4.1]